MKKLVSFLIMFLLIMTPFSVSANVNVIDTNDQNELYSMVKKDTIIETKINEYDEFKKLQNTDENTLLSQGWTEQEIKDLKEFDFEKALKERANLSNENLSKMGYSSSKISSLKENVSNTALSEADLRAYSGVLTLKMGFMSTTNSARDWKIYYEWFWDPQPIFLTKDIIGIKALGSVNGTVAVPTLMSDSIANTNYEFYDNSGSNSVKGSFTRVDLNLAQYVFNMQSTGSNGLKTWARSGYGHVHFNNTTPMDRLTVGVQYGHSQGSLSPSIEISGGSGGISGGVTFAFSYGVNNEASLVKVFSPNGTEL